MAVFLNTDAAYQDFQMLRNDEFFTDKTGMIEKISRKINTKNRFICITKPRRFGKTSILNMLGAYYGKSCCSKALFDGLQASRCEACERHRNQYDVIKISFNELSWKGKEYSDYIGRFQKMLEQDIREAYPALCGREFDSLPDLITASGGRFLFLIDEWDYIFSQENCREYHDDFLELLRDLLKDRPYVVFAYMTGVLPVKQYSTGSALNMFDEYTMLNDAYFDEYFGFTQQETEQLCQKQSKLSMSEISEWYDGYVTDEGKRLYNPRSVVMALGRGKCQSYWTRTGRMDEVLYFLKYNIAEVRDDVIKMVNGQSVKTDIWREYTAGQEPPSSRKEIYAAMIIYGMLSYHERELRIPNQELMLEFQKALEDNEFDEVAQLVRNSSEVLSATLEQKADKVQLYLHSIHNSEIPVLKDNDENSLACVVTLAYLAARNKYQIVREEKGGKGNADFLFYPKVKSLPGIVIELKADGTPQAAIRQIKEKEYCEKLKREHPGKILLVGISYHTKKKEHQCRIEKVHGF